ncbi:MAG TPA: helix-turn-helix domain-containing protein [Ottowia sp.]|uniref:helix-turn-helix domain-containing protein n=1 Tax=Ottowia sp. TaxID=1898956 RepID=UPI002C42898F|nr:helix-turn-helix domain-containing protein [Ottowia sp.]HMN22741.1 helix-turn-helix domain-containing protein [Ottowia sp.]
MNDELLSTLPAPLEARPAQPPASAGAMLRQLRESAGVDAALLASAMKVSLQKLEALEHDRLDQLPDVTFARGLASSICRAFGADPAPVLERMPVVAPGLRATGSKLNQPFRRSSDGPESILSSRGARPWLIAVLALLLGALLLWLWPTSPIQMGPPESATEAPDEAASSSAAGQEAAIAPPPPVEATPAEAPPPPPEESAAPAPPEAVVAPPTAEPAPLPMLTLKASDETWITVRDGSGKTLVNRVLAANETLALDGVAPLAVTVGRKDAVQVEVRGKPLDIRRLGNSSVARFQVNE